MAVVEFYEKPGCINNTRQKKMLQAAGHTVEAKSLLTEVWDAEELKKYFDSLPVQEWFNTSAPDIKSGKIDPAVLDEKTALELMQQQPLLIRRPLMKVDNEYCAGFEITQVDQWLGLIEDGTADLETCPRDSGENTDHGCNVVIAD